MAVLDFPDNPTVGQTYVGPNNIIWAWDGAKWVPSISVFGPASVLFSDTPPATPSVGQLWFDSADGTLYAWYNDGNSLQWVIANNTPGAPGPAGVPGPAGIQGPIGPGYSPIAQGRLTLTSGSPVMTADVAASNNIYYDPYCGNQILIWNGSAWVAYTFTELSLTGMSLWALGNVNYDIFIAVPYPGPGAVPVMALGPAWTNATTRAAAIALFQGVYTNAASMALVWGAGPPVTVPANQAIYIGTCRTNINGQASMIQNPAPASGGGAAYLGLWNMYNRVDIQAKCTDNGAAYTYSTATWRQARASGNNQIGIISGLAEDFIQASLMAIIAPAAVATSYAWTGVGLDSMSGGAAYLLQAIMQSQAAVQINIANQSVGALPPQLGWHTILSGEYSGNQASSFNNQSINSLFVQMRG